MTAAQLATLRALLAAARQHDDALNDAAESPTGDDYNKLYSLVEGMARIVGAGVPVELPKA